MFKKKRNKKQKLRRSRLLRPEDKSKKMRLRSKKMLKRKLKMPLIKPRLLMQNGRLSTLKQLLRKKN